MAGNLFNANHEAQSPFVRSFNCKSCGAAITIRNARDSVTAICASCGSVIDLTDPNFKILVETHQAIQHKPIIPFGSRGRLKGLNWEVIGHLCRMDVESEYHWEEYLLFNPYQGYRWLTLADGHWNFVTPIKESPLSAKFFTQSMSCTKFQFKNHEYKLFYKGKAKVIQVLGEFYWRISVGETLEMVDYIAPPLMLSLEHDQSEQNWSVSEYIEPGVIQSAFKLGNDLPVKKGVAPNQPSKNQAHLKPMLILWALFSMLMIGIQYVHLLLATNDVVYDNAFLYQPNGGNSVVTNSFECRHSYSNVTITLDAPVDQTWLSLDGDLVNEKTGENYSFNQTVEYYSGVAGGESWAEGNRVQTIMMSTVPEGTYHLDFVASGAGPQDISRYVGITGPTRYHIQVMRNVTNWPNFLWLLLLISLPPLLLWWNLEAFERNRWAGSDYSPYKGT